MDIFNKFDIGDWINFLYLIFFIILTTIIIYMTHLVTKMSINSKNPKCKHCKKPMTFERYENNTQIFFGESTQKVVKKISVYFCKKCKREDKIVD